MYTKINDQNQANLIQQYIQQNPNCNQKEIMIGTFTTWKRLKFLEKEGYIILPKPLNYGQRNAVIRKNI